MSCNSYLLGVKLKDIPGGRSNLLLQKYRFINDVLMTSRNDLDLLHNAGIDDRFIFHIPCGSCAACRLQYSRDWAVRLELEMRQHKHNYFVTTTYDDVFLPTGNYVYFNRGIKTYASASLDPKHPRDFIKRFRTKCMREFDHTGIRVFYAGEYGDLHERPHYHYIFMNCPDLSDDFQIFKKEAGFDLFISKRINDLWSHNFGSPRSPILLPMGYTTVCEANYFTAAYTARYVFKKQKGNDLKELFRYQLLEDEERRINPFCHMSNRPGIAGNISDEELRKIYENDSVYYHKKEEVFSSFPPRYFDKLFEDIDPLAFEEVKNRRSDARAYLGNVKQYSEDLESRLTRQEEMIQRFEKKRRRTVC